MKAEFTKYGPKHDYRGAHVTLTMNGRQYLGTIVSIYRDEVLGMCKATVRHFCGDDWPFVPALSALDILERN